MNVMRSTSCRPILLASLVLFGVMAWTSSGFGQQRNGGGGIRALHLPSAGMHVASESKVGHPRARASRPDRAQQARPMPVRPIGRPAGQQRPHRPAPSQFKRVHPVFPGHLADKAKSPVQRPRPAAPKFGFDRPNALKMARPKWLRPSASAALPQAPSTGGRNPGGGAATFPKHLVGWRVDEVDKLVVTTPATPPAGAGSRLDAPPFAKAGRVNILPHRQPNTIPWLKPDNHGQAAAGGKPGDRVSAIPINIPYPRPDGHGQAKGVGRPDERLPNQNLLTNHGTTPEEDVTGNSDFGLDINGRWGLDFSDLEDDSPGGGTNPWGNGSGGGLGWLPGSADPGDLGPGGDLGNPLQQALNGLKSMEKTLDQDNPLGSREGGAKDSSGGPGLVTPNPTSGFFGKDNKPDNTGSGDTGSTGNSPLRDTKLQEFLEDEQEAKAIRDSNDAQYGLVSPIANSGNNSHSVCAPGAGTFADKILQASCLAGEAASVPQVDDPENPLNCEGPDQPGGGKPTAPTGKPTADVVQAILKGTGALVSNPGPEQGTSGGGPVRFLPGQDNAKDSNHVKNPGPEGGSGGGKPTAAAVKPKAELVTDPPEESGN